MIVTAHTHDDWQVFRAFARAHGIAPSEAMPADARVIGTMIGGQMRAAIEFNHFCQQTCYLHAIGTLTGNLIRALFKYAFNDLGMVQLFGPVAATNAQLLRMMRWLGFEELCWIARGWDERTDIVFMGMHVSQCRWLKEKKHAITIQ